MQPQWRGEKHTYFNRQHLGLFEFRQSDYNSSFKVAHLSFKILI